VTRTICATILLCLLSLPASSETIRSHKTGATAQVSAKFAATAQAIIDDLENNYGAAIRFMGGYRKGHGSIRHMHPWGLALDLCQYARGVVDRRCHLPSPAIEAKVARAHGAQSGAEWCNGDRGHIQAQVTAAPCGSRYASAKRHHRHYASR